MARTRSAPRKLAVLGVAPLRSALLKPILAGTAPLKSVSSNRLEAG